MPEAIEARMETNSDLFSVADRVITEGDRVRVRVGDREVAVISVEDLEFLEEVENDLDLLSALKELREAAEDRKFIPLEKILGDIIRSRQADGV